MLNCTLNGVNYAHLLFVSLDYCHGLFDNSIRSIRIDCMIHSGQVSLKSESHRNLIYTTYKITTWRLGKFEHVEHSMSLSILARQDSHSIPNQLCKIVSVTSCFMYTSAQRFVCIYLHSSFIHDLGYSEKSFQSRSYNCSCTTNLSHYSEKVSAHNVQCCVILYLAGFREKWYEIATLASNGIHRRTFFRFA